MATARDMVYGALRLIGQLAEGETPSADTAQDALSAMNQMIDSWNTERLSVFATQDETFTWPADTTSRTMGPTGQFSATRPVQVSDATYFKSGTLSYPLSLINREQYSAIALKASTSTFPQLLFVDMAMPDITLYLWPVPTSSLEFHVVSVEPLTQPANLSTTLVIPPGYLRAFRFNLAVEVAAEFGVEAPPTVKRIADVSKRNIKRINNPNELMSMPYALVSRRRNNFNIFTGT
jgi:hypothetical protein